VLGVETNNASDMKLFIINTWNVLLSSYVCKKLNALKAYHFT